MISSILILLSLTLALSISLLPSSSSQKVPKTVFQYSRYLETCDVSGDNNIETSGTTKFLYASNPTQHPQNDKDFKYHGNNRGISNVNMFDRPYAYSAPPTTKTIDIISDPIVVPAIDTYYHCQVFAVDIPQKLHIIKFIPQVNNTNMNIVHHSLLYHCTNPLSPSSQSYRGSCYDNTPNDVQQCQTSIVAAFAVGGSPLVLPEIAGLPLEQGTQYLMLEIHYNNEKSINYVDQSGFSLVVTPNLRKEDAGVTMMGRFLQSIVVPPKQEDFVVKSYCPMNCTAPIPSSGINIFGNLMHSHLAGREMSLHHYREGVEIQMIDKNKFYDFNFQQTVSFNPPRTFLPGDELYLEQHYNTMDRNGTTYGGYSTMNEMSFAFFFYYPYTPLLDFCESGNPMSNNNEPIPNVNYASCPAFQSSIGPFADWEYQALPTYPCQLYKGEGNNYTIGTADTTYIPVEDLDLSSSYEHQQVLDTLGKYVLYYNIHNDTNGDKNDNRIIDIAIEVETEGWLGLGIASTGSMIGGDIALGYVNSTSTPPVVDLTDRKAVAHSPPVIDSSQDIMNIRGSKGLMDKIVPPKSEIYMNWGVVQPMWDCSGQGSCTKVSQ